MTQRTKYREVLARVEEAASRCGRAGQVRLVAVSKAQPVERLLAAREDGCDLFGENYAQELVKKAEVVAGVTWHFIGHLQSNKVKAILPHVSLIHSVDRSSLLREIDRRAAALGKRQPILIEVNVGRETSKSGVTEEDLPGLVHQALEKNAVELRGLMAIPPFAWSPEETRQAFRRLRELRDGLEQRFGESFPELSMGMSGDFEAAIEEGATLVRVGTAIFGPRPLKR